MGTRGMKTLRALAIINITGIAIIGILALCFCYNTTVSSTSSIKAEAASNSYTTQPTKEYVFTEIPGITYECNNDNLKKIIYLVKESPRAYYVYSQATHLDEIQDTMTINEYFIVGDESIIENESKTVTIDISDTNQIRVIDHRTGVIMPMSGVYKLSRARKALNETVEIEALDAEPLTESSNEIPNTFVEYETYQLHARFIKNIDSNGMEFITANDQVVYVFGGQFKCLSGTWMDLELIYRGHNPRYNGHDFGGVSEHCFNLVKVVNKENTDERD